MNVFARILIGLIIMTLGFVIVRGADRVYDWFGTVDWAEEKLGPGRSIFFYRLIGVAVCFLGVLVVTNLVARMTGSLVQLFL